MPLITLRSRSTLRWQTLHAARSSTSQLSGRGPMSPFPSSGMPCAVRYRRDRSAIRSHAWRRRGSAGLSPIASTSHDGGEYASSASRSRIRAWDSMTRSTYSARALCSSGPKDDRPVPMSAIRLLSCSSDSSCGSRPESRAAGWAAVRLRAVMSAYRRSGCWCATWVHSPSVRSGALRKPRAHRPVSCGRQTQPSQHPTRPLDLQCEKRSETPVSGHPGT